MGLHTRFQATPQCSAEGAGEALLLSELIPLGGGVGHWSREYSRVRQKERGILLQPPK